MIDLRTVAPLDIAPILESVAKTGRLLIAHEAVVPVRHRRRDRGGRRREAFWDLDAPIERVGAAATPPPYAPDLEQAWLPDRDDIATPSAASPRPNTAARADSSRDVHDEFDEVG